MNKSFVEIGDLTIISNNNDHDNSLLLENFNIDDLVFDKNSDKIIVRTNVLQKISEFKIDLDQIYTINEVIEKMQNKINKLYTLLRKISTIFEENGIKFILSSGTLLGYTRHSQIIPWDDDIDIEILEEDAEKLEKINWESHGLQYAGWSPRGLLYLVQNKDDKSIYIDIFSSRNKKESIVGGYINRPGIEPAIIPKELVFPFKKTTFCDIPVYVPNNPIEVCKKMYGENVLDICYIWNHHFNNQWSKNFNLSKMKLSMDAFNYIESLNIKKIENL